MTSEPNPQYAGEIVATLASAIFHGSHTLENLPGLLRRIIDEELWRNYERADGTRSYLTFADFIEHGLGSNIATLRHLCKDDPVSLDSLDQAVTNAPGKRPRVNVDNIHIIKRPSGTSASRAIRRLRHQFPTLHQRVLAGELSPSKAAIEAGFRKKQFSVFVGDPDRAARLLKRHFSAEEIRRIIEGLSQ